MSGHLLYDLREIGVDDATASSQFVDWLGVVADGVDPVVFDLNASFDW